jgi:hypothetical protein
MRPDDDSYWERVNKLTAEKTVVPATTLDTLCTQLALKPPFLLKLDVQGAEANVLRGASGLLQQSHVVICEADVDDFQTINAILHEKEFILFDLTTIVRVDEGTLGWFYPVYIHRALEFVRPKAFWDTKANEAVIQMQTERRNAILKSNAEILDRIRNRHERTPSPARTGRNHPCPCGSGRRYKHCCGANR